VRCLLSQISSHPIRSSPAFPFLQELQTCFLSLLHSHCRYLSKILNRIPLLGPSPSADAAARLARLEALVEQQRAALQEVERRSTKEDLRHRLHNAEVREPLKHVQGSLLQHAEALGKLAGTQQQLRMQLDGAEQVMAALQGLAAKQFTVRLMD
jgi:hypothetical protein